MTERVRALSELRRTDAPAFGGKSAGLGELLAAGIPVPPGFALACSALSPAESRAPIPSALRDAVALAYADLARVTGTPDPAVAARSSAVGEDSSEATFAGQQETVLWVRGVEPLCEAIRVCRASLYSPTAVAYRAQLGPPDEGAAMGVTVQAMVEPEVAGVLFTCNPLSGDLSVVAINASWGLGVAVVDGDVTPDEFLLSKVTGETVRERIGTKAIEFVAGPGGSGTARVEVTAERRSARCLDRDALAELLALAVRVERHFGAPQDVEWAVTSAGELFALQSRPVTGLRAREPTAPEPASALALVMRTFGVGR
jgi:pyruvate,water dikinase